MKRVQYPAALQELIAQLRQMPGIGPRSAERIALWMVQARNQQPETIAAAITSTRNAVWPCALCGFFAVSNLCEICTDDSRAKDLLCVVEQPTDILPWKNERLPWALSFVGWTDLPLDRVAPEDLRIAALIEAGRERAA